MAERAMPTTNPKVNRATMWASHLPLLEALLRNVAPKTIVECGMGHASTPLFLEYGTKTVFSVEHDRAWYRRILGSIDRTPSFVPRLVELGHGITSFTLRAAASRNQINAIEDAYASIALEVSGLGEVDLLFVDTFSAARLSALVHLHSFAHLIIFHDSEPRNFKGYCYDRFMDDFGGRYRRFSFRPPDPYPWTELLVDESARLDLGGIVIDLIARSRALFGRESSASLVVSL